jgi:hypothetical protein
VALPSNNGVIEKAEHSRPEYPLAAPLDTQKYMVRASRQSLMHALVVRRAKDSERRIVTGMQP